MNNYKRFVLHSGLDGSFMLVDCENNIITRYQANFIGQINDLRCPYSISITDAVKSDLITRSYSWKSDLYPDKCGDYLDRLIYSYLMTEQEQSWIYCKPVCCDYLKLAEYNRFNDAIRAMCNLSYDFASKARGFKNADRRKKALTSYYRTFLSEHPEPPTGAKTA